MLFLTAEKTRDLVHFVQRHFPNWQGFSDERFINEEIAYKQNAVQKAKELLDKQSLLNLIDQKKYTEFIDRLIKVAQGGKNLLYLAAPKQSDINILYSDDLDQQSFCKAFFNLLYGEGKSIDRLEKYLYYVEENQLPNKWTFPTYYLFVCFPESEIFVKPQTIQWFLQFSGREENLPSIPSIEIYSQYIGLAQQLLESLQKYQPRDFIDIQSFIWVAYSENKNQKTLSNPFQKMFEDWEQANWAFDLLEITAEILNIKKPDDGLITVTGKFIPNGYRIRMTYGVWLVLGITGKNSNIEMVEIALFKEKAQFPNLYEGEFKQSKDEPEISLFNYSYEVFKENEHEILNIYTETIKYILERFQGRNTGIHHRNNNETLCSAIISRAKREQFLSTWEGTDISVESPDGTTKYWKIAPGENAWNWEKCKEGGFIAMGWDELGDISNLSHEEFKIRSQEILKQHSDWGPKGFEQVWDFLQIEEGDRIVANRGTKEVLGIGTVTGAYYFVPDETHGHRLPVRWDDTNIRPIQKKNWVRTIIELSKKDFDTIANSSKPEPPQSMLNEKTFDLLAQLDKNPNMEFYSEHKEEFSEFVETPIQELLLQSVDLLNPEILKMMETEKNLFSRFNKNDYGRGGAWPFYWGAFYLKNGKRNTDPQLSVWLNYERLSLGFFIGVYGEEARLLFRQNCQENAEILVDLLVSITNDSSLVIGNERDVEVQPNGKIITKNKFSWQDWFNDPEEAGYDIAKVLPKDQVLKISFDALLQIVADTFNQLYPLVLLAISEDPIPLIHKYLGTVKLRTPNPTYSISQFAEESGMQKEELQKWVRAIDRKGQVVLYGPPGTGKTYVAEKLARLLVGGGHGFFELIQFHPEVAYEDFIQGIRPQANSEDGLSYPLLPGRFLQFCEKANLTEDTCVLIIDEINRANLARVFGELMYLLEYRDRSIFLAAGRKFKIPKNVRIIGTMNTADRSIALVDHALRRRFAFLALYPNFSILKKYHQSAQTGFETGKLIGVLEDLNKEIQDQNYKIGTSYFLREDLADQIEDIWQMEIEPYLEEFFFDQPEKYERYRWDKVKEKIL